MRIFSKIFYQMATIDIQTAGFDVATPTRYTNFTIMSLTQQSAAGSLVQITGPIATLHNHAETSANIGFAINKNGIENSWSGALAASASTTLLSNGFHDLSHSRSEAEWL
ncbi:hypothetical protein PENTCL1PPCAC_21551, partial [Pristionchus entomophagus]